MTPLIAQHANPPKARSGSRAIRIVAIHPSRADHKRVYARLRRTMAGHLRMTGKENNRRTNVIPAGRHMARGRENGRAAKVAKIVDKIVDTASRLTTRTAALAAARPIADIGADAYRRRQARRAH